MKRFLLCYEIRRWAIFTRGYSRIAELPDLSVNVLEGEKRRILFNHYPMTKWTRIHFAWRSITPLEG